MFDAMRFAVVRSPAHQLIGALRVILRMRRLAVILTQSRALKIEGRLDVHLRRLLVRFRLVPSLFLRMMLGAVDVEISSLASNRLRPFLHGANTDAKLRVHGLLSSDRVKFND